MMHGPINIKFHRLLFET